MIGVAVEYGFGETDEALRAFVDQTGVTFPITRSNGELFTQVDWPGALSPFPRQLLLDRNHRVAYVASEHRQDELEAAVEEAVGR